MQTFLPYPSFTASASVLDRQRLGKQRVEAMQILQTLRGEKHGWKKHPAVKMWRGYEDALIYYLHAVCDEWTKRGYRDTIKSRYPLPPDYTPPPWLGNVAFHVSHQSNLMRKDTAYYLPRLGYVSIALPYIWPEPEV